MTRVDVGVPCYGYGHFLRECLESVLNQKDVEVRVLILDDASPDDTPNVAAALAAKDSRITYRRHAANRGHSATYNEGLDWAEADWQLIPTRVCRRASIGSGAVILAGLTIGEDALVGAGAVVTHGVVACFSFHPRKLLTTGGRGNADHRRP